MKQKSKELILTFAVDLQGRFNNKSIVGSAPTSRYYKVVTQNFKNIKKVYKMFKNDFDKSSMIIDSIVKDDINMQKNLRLTKENFNNQSQWLVLDIERSDTLGESAEYNGKIKTEKDIKNIVRNILGFTGSYILTSSSRWELKGESGWHVYIPLTNTIDRKILKKWLITKLNDSRNLWIGCSWKNSTPSNIQYKRSDIIDLEIYSTGRKIYEAEQIESIGNRKKIVKLIKGDGSYLSTRSIHTRIKQYRKAIIYQKSRVVKKQLKLNNANGIKKYGTKKAWKKHNEEVNKGLLKPTDILYIQGIDGKREPITVLEIVNNGKDIRYEALRSNPGSFDGAYYADKQIFYDYKDDRSFRVKNQSKHFRYKIKEQYIDSKLILNEDGITYICAPTGTGKTYFIKNIEGTKILLVPTKALCENLHNTQDNMYYLQASSDTKMIEGTITKIKEGMVNIMTYDKFNSLMEYNELDKKYKIYVDEVQNMFHSNNAKTTAKLEQNIKQFDRVTFLSASLNKKYLPFIDRSYIFSFKRKLNITILQQGDMARRIHKKGFHIIYNENKQENIDTSKDMNALNVYSGNLSDIENNKIDTNQYRCLFATSVMSEGVSLFLDKPQTVYIHITKATDASLVIQMANRIRNAKKIKVFIYTNDKMYQHNKKAEIEINISTIENNLNRLKDLWNNVEVSREDIFRYKTMLDQELNSYAKAIDIKTEEVSYSNLLTSIREYEKKLERKYLQYFKRNIKGFTPCKIKIKDDKNKISIIKKNNYNNFSNTKELEYYMTTKKEDLFSLPIKQQKQVNRYKEIKTLLEERLFEKKIDVTDEHIFALSTSDLKVKNFKRHIKLLDQGVYDYFNTKRIFRYFPLGEVLQEKKLVSLAKRIIQNAQYLKLIKCNSKDKTNKGYIKFLQSFIQIEQVDEYAYKITSYSLWGD